MIPYDDADLADIERTLADLLTAAIEDDARVIRDVRPDAAARVFRYGDPVPLPAEREIRALIDQPVGAACRQAIRRLGQCLFDLTGSVDGMREVGERAADREPQRFGRRVSIIEHTWNGIGAGADVWWA